jgi:NAD(P)-dependent dehydrogenase (short-subunit alcohol dehydrogenase family)
VSQTVLITGATGGLGLAAARTAALREDVRVLVAGRSVERAKAAAVQANGDPVVIDLGSLAGVRACARDLPPIDALACNAGVKVLARESTTVDGFDETFQVNHLSHLVLIDELIARGDGLRRIVLIGSSTHNPAQRGRIPPPLDADAETLARGGPEGVSDSIGLRRYATSKLLTTATALGLAREHPERHVTCLDPGFMPGTGLGRHSSAGEQRLHNITSRVVRMLSLGATPERSGRALAALLLDEPAPAASGNVVDSRLQPGVVSRRARDEAFQDDVIRTSRTLAATTASI